VERLRIYGKGEKLRYAPLHPGSLDRINEYLDAAGRGALPSAALLKPIRNNWRGTTDTALTTHGVYESLKFYGRKVGGAVDRFGPHSARATAAINAVDQGADTAKVQEWPGHANVNTIRVYDHRTTRPEDSPVFTVSY
jgi:integrase/recombinase XerD